MLVLDSTMEAVERIRLAKNVGDVAANLSIFAAARGFEYHHIVRASVRELPLSRKQMLAVWPKAWFEQYDSERLVKHDLVAKHCKSSPQAFRWSDVAISNDSGRNVMAIADRDYGMKNGLCIPYFGLGGYQGAISFAGRNIDRSREGDQAIEVVAVYAFHHLNGMRTAEPNGYLLTARQREVLKWVASGKTTWETAEIIRISEHTVKQTIRSAMLRLNVYTRAQAVVEAVRQGEINL